MRREHRQIQLIAAEVRSSLANLITVGYAGMRPRPTTLVTVDYCILHYITTRPIRSWWLKYETAWLFWILFCIVWPLRR